MELVNDFTVNAGIEETWKTLTDLELIAPCMPGAQLTEVEGETYRGLVKVKVGPITAQFKGQAHFVERDADRHKAVLKADGRDTGGKGNASALITAQLDGQGATSTKVTVTTDLTITGKVAQFGRGALADVSDKLLKQFVHNLETTVLSEDAAHGHGPSDGASWAAPAAEAAAMAPTGAEAIAGPDTAAGDPRVSASASGDESTTSASKATATPSGTSPTAKVSPAVEATEASTSNAPATSASGTSTSGTSAGTSGTGTSGAPTVRKIESKPAEPIDLLETAGAPMLKRLAPLAGVLLLVLFLLRRRRQS